MEVRNAAGLWRTHSVVNPVWLKKIGLDPWSLCLQVSQTKRTFFTGNKLFAPRNDPCFGDPAVQQTSPTDAGTKSSHSLVLPLPWCDSAHISSISQSLRNEGKLGIQNSREMVHWETLSPKASPAEVVAASRHMKAALMLLPLGTLLHLLSPPTASNSLEFASDWNRRHFLEIVSPFLIS